jgi:hypothetical protein
MRMGDGIGRSIAVELSYLYNVKIVEKAIFSCEVKLPVSCVGILHLRWQQKMV